MAAPFEQTRRKSTAACDSNIKARGDFTHSSGDAHVGIAPEIEQSGRGEEIQDRLHDRVNYSAENTQVTTEVEQPLPDQVSLIVRRPLRQRQGVIVLDVDEDTTAAE